MLVWLPCGWTLNLPLPHVPEAPVGTLQGRTEDGDTRRTEAGEESGQGSPAGEGRSLGVLTHPVLTLQLGCSSQEVSRAMGHSGFLHSFCMPRSGQLHSLFLVNAGHALHGAATPAARACRLALGAGLWNLIGCRTARRNPARSATFEGCGEVAPNPC